MDTIVTGLATAAVVLASFAAEADEPDAESAKSFVRSWVETFNANEPNKMMEFYDQSDELVAIMSSRRRYRGFRNVHTAYRADQGLSKAYDSTPLNMSVRLIGKTAIVTFEHRFKIRYLQGGEKWQFHIQTTSVLHWVDDKWKVFHEHSSPIRGTDRMTRIQD